MLEDGMVSIGVYSLSLSLSLRKWTRQAEKKHPILCEGLRLLILQKNLLWMLVYDQDFNKVSSPKILTNCCVSSISLCPQNQAVGVLGHKVIIAQGYD